MNTSRRPRSTAVGNERTQLEFDVPANSAATSPPEIEGLGRDDVRLIVARDRRTPRVEHRAFTDLGDALQAGDVLVTNTSATLPAAIIGHDDAEEPVLVHFSTALDESTWVVEIRNRDNAGPDTERRIGESIALPGGIRLTLGAPHPPETASVRLRRTTVSAADGRAPVPAEYLSRYGRPIVYDYLGAARFPLERYQTVFARTPGSAEMPSAARPFTERGVVDLMTRGVLLVPILLHCGVSSPDANEAPSPEPFVVPPDTARAVNSARAAGRRVVAVGTSAARAIETVARPDGFVADGRGWTDLVLGPDRPARTTTGLLTGLHMPEASHLLLLQAVAGTALVRAAYEAATGGNYRWHEFGDANLFLP